MGYVGNTPAEKYASFAVQNFSVSATANYTLDHPVANENDIRLVINNVVQHPGSGKAYTASGTTLTLSEATAGTDTMYCVFLGKAVQTVTPSNSSVTNAMLVADSVNATKIADDSISDEHLDITAITGQTAITSLADTDKFLVSDASDSGNLKYVENQYLGGGGLVPLAQTSATGASASEVALESFTDASKYAYYTVQIRFEPNTNGAGIMMRYRNGSSNIDGTDYRSTIFESRNLSGTVNTNSVNGGWGTSDPEFVDSCSVHTHSFIMDFFPKGHGITSGSGLNYNLSIFRGLSWEWTGSAHQLRTIISNFIYDNSSSTANGFYIYPSTGTFYKYDVRAYGVKLS